MFGLGMSASVAAHAGEKAPVAPVESSKSTTEVMNEATTLENNAEVVNFAAEREIAIKRLEEEKKNVEDQLHHRVAELQGFQNNFSSAESEALKYLGKKKSKVAGFENALADLAMKMGEEKVGSENITSPEAIDGLLGILLSDNGPLKEQATALTGMLQEQLGSPVMMTTNKPGKYISPDMELHTRLSKGPRDIISAALQVVEEKHNLEQVVAQLQDLKGDTNARAEIPQVTF